MPPTRAKRILVVDDEPSITLGIQMNLESLGGYKVRTENEGRKTLKAARVFQPDLILLDIMMPDADGAEVASRLAEDPETRDIPVVFLTAIVAKRETGNRETTVGGRTFLAKPATMPEILDCIARHVRGGGVKSDR